MSTHTHAERNNRSAIRPSDRGLTLTELLVVITVLGILAAVSVMSIAGATESGNDAAVQADADVIRTAQEVHRSQFGRYADEDELVDAGLVSRPSQLHDIVVEADGQYRLVRADGTVDDPDSGDAAASGSGSNGGDSAAGSTTTSEVGSTTAAPTTAAPTTAAPTTAAPITAAPTTAAPTTAAPTTAAPTTAAPTTTAPSTFANVNCTFTVTNAWNSGGNGSLEIANDGSRPLGSWTVRIDPQGTRIQLWSAAQEPGDPLVARDRGWNATVAPGQSRAVTGGGITGAGLAVGQAFPCTVIDETPDVAAMACTFTVSQAWNSGGNAVLEIQNNDDVSVAGWTVTIERSDVAIAIDGARTVSSTDSAITVESDAWAGSVDANSSAARTSSRLRGSGLSIGQTFDCSVVEVY